MNIYINLIDVVKKMLEKDADKILDKLNIGMGRRFVFFGGTGLLVSLWVNNELGIKISLVTFIFGGFAKIIEMLNKRESVKNNTEFQTLVWLIFLIFYIFAINSNIQIIQIC